MERQETTQRRHSHLYNNLLYLVQIRPICSNSKETWVTTLEDKIAGLDDKQVDEVFGHLYRTLDAKFSVSGEPNKPVPDADARAFLAPYVTATDLDDIEASADLKRLLLLAFAADKDLRSCVESALEKRILAATGLEFMAVAALIVMVLSIKFDGQIEKDESGEIKWRVSVSKSATSEKLIKTIISDGSSLVRYLMHRNPDNE